MGTPEPKMGSAEFDRLYAEYRASGGKVSWETWLVDRPEDKSCTPLGDALAVVDRAQAEVMHNWSRSVEETELEALRALAEAVRLHVNEHPETIIPLSERASK
jgi:hypothetical protein